MPVARCCLRLSLGLPSASLVFFTFSACSRSGITVSSAVVGDAAWSFLSPGSSASAGLMFAFAGGVREDEAASREELGCRPCSVSWEACARTSAEEGGSGADLGAVASVETEGRVASEEVAFEVSLRGFGLFFGRRRACVGIVP